MGDMIRDVGAEAFAQAHVYETMSTDVKIPLYVGSTKFTRLSAVLRLMNLKATNGWTDKSFTELLVLLNKMLPKEILYPLETMTPRKFFVRWVWSIKGYTYVLMIAYYTENNLKI